MSWHGCNVIPCRWKQTPAGWHLWVKGHSTIKGEGSDFDTAQEALIESIMDHAPDLDQVIPVVPDFSPPLPATTAARAFLSPEIYKLSGDGIFECHIRSDERKQWARTLYSDGICEKCNAMRGERTDVPMIIDDHEAVDAGFIRGSVRGPFGLGNGIFSHRFLELLRPDELSQLCFQPIEKIGRGGKRKYFELVGRPRTAFAGVQGLDADGCECMTCGWRSWSIREPALQRGGICITKFMCHDDLPRNLDSIFPVADEASIYLCASRQRWNELQGKIGTKGLSATNVGIVSNEQCDLRPRLPPRERTCTLCAEWPEPVDVQFKSRRGFPHNEQVWSFRNWTWIRPAAEKGLLRLMRETIPLETLRQMTDERIRFKKPEIVSFRCVECWRLGQIRLEHDYLFFNW